MKLRTAMLLAAFALCACLGVAGDLDEAPAPAAAPPPGGAPPPPPGQGTPTDASVAEPADAGVQDSGVADAGTGTPDACVPLLRIGLGVFYVRQGNEITNRTGSESNPAFVGDVVMMNSTPRVAEYPGDARGLEQPLACTDPNGPNWTMTKDGAPQTLNIRPNPYLASFNPSSTGNYVIRACPRQPPGTCGEVTVYVR